MTGPTRIYTDLKVKIQSVDQIWRYLGLDGQQSVAGQLSHGQTMNMRSGQVVWGESKPPR